MSDVNIFYDVLSQDKWRFYKAFELFYVVLKLYLCIIIKDNLCILFAELTR